MGQKSQVSSRGLMAGISSMLICLGLWAYGLFFAITEAHQGDVYRIIYLHVPSAFTCFFCALVLFIFSIKGLRGKSSSLLYGKATAEVGLLFTIITLATGSIWGKPTWGVWWTWDARLTTTFILSLLYCGYLLLWSAMQPGSGRVKVCSILGILIFADVPIIYKSVTWWRTLHQPPSILRENGPTMAPEILYLLLSCSFAVICLSVWMVWIRSQNLKLEENLNKASYQQLEEQEANS
ncbi:MAG: cytochrome c biogenesis protein CcsA [Oligoflexales bacterium]|nr:cytochrome c biogenesis protein CcsA [Oligoflexales bacterium]